MIRFGFSSGILGVCEWTSCFFQREIRGQLVVKNVVRVWIFAGDRAAFEARAESGGGFAVAEEAEGAEIVEVALASAFGYGADVVRVP